MDLIDPAWYALGVGILVGLLFWFLNGTLPAAGEEKCSPEVDLKLLSKIDYDFLRGNGLEVDQEIHDHFYKPHRSGNTIYRQPLDKWGVEAIELNPRVRELAAEQRRGIAQQKALLSKAKSEREYEELRPALIEAENAIRAKYQSKNLTSA